jgi:hypothetical protein
LRTTLPTWAAHVQPCGSANQARDSKWQIVQLPRVESQGCIHKISLLLVRRLRNYRFWLLLQLSRPLDRRHPVLVKYRRMDPKYELLRGELSKFPTTFSDITRELQRLSRDHNHTRIGHSTTVKRCWRPSRGSWGYYCNYDVSSN